MKITENTWVLNEIVEYDNGVMKGRGRILGVAVSPGPVIGASMIVEDMSHNIPTDEYPFTHFTVFECHLKKV